MTKEQLESLKKCHEPIEQYLNSKLEINRFAKKLFKIFIIVFPLAIGLAIFLGIMK